MARSRRPRVVAAVAAIVAAIWLSIVPASAQDGSPAPERSFLPGIKEFGLTEEEYAAAIEGVQAQIAACMEEAGFEYLPVDVQTIALAQEAVRHEPGMDRRQYKLQWGYGVTTRFDNRVKEIELGPNLAIMENLPESDRRAYERKLYGRDTDATFAFTFDEEDFETTGGCTRKAIEATFPKEMLKETFVNPKDVLIEEDPRVIKANADWSTCMADAGYDGYLDQDEIIEEYQEELDALLGEDDPEALTGRRLDRLAELQAAEIAVSLVDLDCQLEYLDDVIREVEIEVFGFPVSG